VTVFTLMSVIEDPNFDYDDLQGGSNVPVMDERQFTSNQVHR